MGKLIGVVIVLALIIWVAIFSCFYISSGIELNNVLTGYWDVADKSATIEKKSEYVDKFVGSIEKLKLNEGNSAVVFKSYSNYMPNNYDAIKSLQKRLHEVKDMDPKSFQYQTAMQQLTGQEWGEAHDLINQFEYKWNNTYSFFVRGVGGLVGAVIWLFLLGISMICFVIPE